MMPHALLMLYDAINVVEESLIITTWHARSRSIPAAYHRAIAARKWSQRVNQLTYATNKPKNTILRTHGGRWRPLEVGSK